MPLRLEIKVSGFQEKTAGLRRTLGYIRSFLMYRSNPLRAGNMARLYSLFVGQGDLYFDIGAHIGSHVSVMLKLGARVVAVEPHPGCVKILRRLYGRNPNAVIVPKAVADREGEGALYASRLSPTLSSMFPDWINSVKNAPGFSGSRWEDTFQVEATTLDRLIETYGAPAFCKIDVEGGELEALQGLSQPLSAVSFEYISAVMERAVPCMDYLSGLGNYEFNWIPGEGKPFGSPRWLGPGEMKNKLGLLAQAGGSGDIYARKKGRRQGGKTNGE